jgi:hypothetical protein
MKKRWLVFLLFALPAAAGWKPLFDGKDFAGWERVGKALWTIEEGGVIVGSSDPANPGTGWLVTEKEYSDFRLRLKFWITPGGNSGIGIRDPSHARGPQSPAHMGYEIQILDAPGAKNPTGSIYLLAPAPDGKIRSGQWNEFLITCRGPHIEVELNGEKVSEIDHDRSRRGAIGLQMHSKNMTVKFKDLQIEEQ